MTAAYMRNASCVPAAPPPQSTDAATIPAVVKAKIRDELAGLGKKVLEAAKAAAAANKQVAVSKAVATAEEAVAAGSSVMVARVDVGSDMKALIEAWSAISSSHKGLCALMVSVDTDAGKVLAYAGVPDGLVGKIKANEWVGEALKVLGGKGGGRPTAAQGQGTEVTKVDDALAVATEFAKLKL